MHEVRTLDPTRHSDWDKFVQAHPFGWICHLSAWKNIVEQSFDHIRGKYLVLVNDQTGAIEAGLPIFHVKSWITGKRLVSVPFASLCDPLATTKEQMHMLLAEALNEMKKAKADHIEIRTLHNFEVLRNGKMQETGHFFHHYLPLADTPEKLMKKFHRTCVRQRITRALKSELGVRIGDKEADMRAFYQLYMTTRKRLGLPTQPYRFFHNLHKTLLEQGQVELLLAQTENQTIAGLILLKFKNRVSAEFLASDDTFKSVSPNHYLFWQAIQRSYNEGYASFDFGRTATTNEPLLDFKRRWGTQVVTLKHFYFPAGNSASQMSDQSPGYRLMRRVCYKAPDFMQGILGNFCYRHLG